MSGGGRPAKVPPATLTRLLSTSDLCRELAEAAAEAFELLDSIDPEEVAGWSMEDAQTLAVVRTRLARDIGAYRQMAAP